MSHDQTHKHDAGKPRMDLLPFPALYEVSRVLSFGADEYAAYSWTEVETERYVAAMLRHLTAMSRSELYDRKSGLLHAAHAACDALFVLQKYLVGKGWKQPL